MAFILLVSTKTDQKATRQYAYFTNKNDLSRTIIQHFEDFLNDRERERLAKIGLTVEEPCVEYTSEDLWEFMNEFYSELVCLVKEEGFDNLWIPQPIEWVKETIQIYLRIHYSKKLPKNPLDNCDETSARMDVCDE